MSPQHDIFMQRAAKANADSSVAAAAAEQILSGNVIGLALSGKLASGKDTVAPAALSRIGVATMEHMFFARPIKDEFNGILRTMRAAPSAVAAQAAVADQFDLPVEAAGRLVDLIRDQAVANPDLRSTDRTPEMRAALQYIGTDVRRQQDPDWWVNISLRSALDVLAEGRSVFFTDTRFPNEAEAVRDIGFTVVRLDITDETQRTRLADRDGLAPDPAAVNHPSETALDNYNGFDVRISNDGPIEHAIAATINAIKQPNPVTL